MTESDQHSTRTSRLRQWYSKIKEPQHVEKASKSERRKRGAWQVLSTVLSFVAVGIPVAIIDILAPWFPPTGIVGIATAVAMVGTALLLDIYVVFPWGFDRFDLVTPWQFRDAEVEENE